MRCTLALAWRTPPIQVQIFYLGWYQDLATLLSIAGWPVFISLAANEIWENFEKVI